MDDYIKKEAAKLYKEVIAAYNANPTLTMGEILNSFLAQYNDKIGAEIEAEIINAMSASFSSSTLINANSMTTPTLSKSLFYNAEQTARVTKKILEEHFKNQSTIEEIRKELYDGHGYEEILPIKKTLPKYLQKPLAEEKVNRLKTKPLKAAYFKVLNAKNDKQLERALKVALEERARQYAQRIADTEEARYFNLANAQRQIDSGIKFVRWTLSSRHKVKCVCDFFARQDVGYGAGIYPLMNAPMPVSSTHVFCKCSLRDYHRTPTFKEVKNPITKTMSTFDDATKRKIAGSEAKLQQWKQGVPLINIWNTARPNYKYKTVSDIFTSPQS